MTTNAKVVHTANYVHVLGTPVGTGTITTNNQMNSILPLTYPLEGTAIPYNGPYNGVFTSTTFSDAISKGGFPIHNLIETPTSFIVELAVAGWKKKDLTIEVSDKDLLVSGVTSHSPLSQGETYIQRGITRSQFNKTIALGPNIDQDKIEAKYEDGLLTVTIQKRITVKKVPIKVSIK